MLNQYANFLDRKLSLSTNTSVSNLKDMNLKHQSRVNTRLDNVQTSADLISQSLDGNNLEVCTHLDLIKRKLDDHSKALATLRPEYERTLQIAQTQILNSITHKTSTHHSPILSLRKRVATRVLPRSFHRPRSKGRSVLGSPSQAEEMTNFLEESLGILRKFEHVLCHDTVRFLTPGNGKSVVPSWQQKNRHERRNNFASSTLPELIQTIIDGLQAVAGCISHIKPEKIEKSFTSL
jgi:hypothetical protein